MTEIRFYHLQTSNQNQALPMLISKAYDQGKRVLVKMPDAKEVEAFDKHLWTFKPDSFIPHASAKSNKGDNAGLQPVWLTDCDENPNKAELLIITQGASSEMAGDFSLCCEMFDGRSDEAVKAARERWKAYKDQGFEVTYWKQDEQGRWAKSS